MGDADHLLTQAMVSGGPYNLSLPSSEPRRDGGHRFRKAWPRNSRAGRPVAEPVAVSGREEVARHHPRTTPLMGSDVTGYPR